MLLLEGLRTTLNNAEHLKEYLIIDCQTSVKFELL